ncbi:MAG: cell division protein FtsX [Gaiellaceae bacterium]
MRLRMLVSEAFRSMTANISTTVAATLTVLIGMFLVGTLIGFGTWARSWSDAKKQELVVKVYFCTEIECPKTGEATDAQIGAVQRQLESNPLIRQGGVRLIPKAEALKLMTKQHPEITEGLVGNPLPDAFEITPKRGEDTAAIARSLSPQPPGVDEVKYAEKTTSRVLQLARVIESVFLVAIAILLIAAMVLIANTIRLSIFSRRREIEVMKLVGASNWFVRGPFMLEGLICGLVGSALAVVMLLVAREAVAARILDDIGAADGAKAVAFGINALILCGIGLLLGAAGSGLTVRRFLKV